MTQNIAPSDCDLSHPKYFRKQKHAQGTSKIAPENVGQPGCTDAERQRFSEILEVGDMGDVYRHLHEVSSPDEMTWRGAMRGKFGDKGMRIDHCIASSCLLPKIEGVQILGREVRRDGFMGSDHCPLLILCSDGIEMNPKQSTCPADVEAAPSCVGDSSDP